MARAVLLACLAGALALLIASALLTPVSNDAGTYLSQAEGILAGKLPYRDFFDHKTPGTYALYALILAVTRHSLAAVQLAQAAGVALAAGLTALLTWRRWGALAGALAGLITLYGGTAFAGAHLTTEAWVGVLTAAALTVLLRPAARPGNLDWLLAGTLVGLSALFKQTGVLTLAAFGLWALLNAGSTRSAIRSGLALVLGCLLPIALAAAFFAANGAWPDLWRDTVWINATAYPRQSLSVLVRGNLANARSFPLLFIGLVSALAWAPPALRRQSPRGAETLLWLTLASGLVPLLHRYYGHYLLQPLPAAAALAGIGLAAGWQRLARRSVWMRAALLLALAVVALIDIPRWPAYLTFTGRLVEEQRQAAAAVQSLTDPQDPILAISAAPQYYFLSQRPPATRWLYLYPVNYTAGREAELARIIAGHAVKAIVVDDGNPMPWHPRLRDAVEAACHLHRQIGATLSVYRCP